MRSRLAALLLFVPSIAVGAEGLKIERVIGTEFPGRYKHPASIEKFDNGDLFIAYYSGDGEYAEDTKVMGMRKRSAATTWSTPRVIADTPGRSEGNAVVWQAPDRVVWLFYVCRYGETWSTSRIKVKLSYDHGETWTDPFILAFEQGMMVRNRPIVLSDGDYLLPVYLEKGEDREAVESDSVSRFLRYSPATKTWTDSGQIKSANGNIQPAVAVIADSHLVAYCRRGGGYGPTTNGYIVKSESRDGGRTWARGVNSEFPNPNAAVDFLRLQSGNHLLIYNRSMNDRTPLSAALSTNRDKSYPHRVDLIEGDGPFAYPFAIQAADGTIHLVYTTEDRTVIKLAEFTEELLHSDHSLEK